MKTMTIEQTEQVLHDALACRGKIEAKLDAMQATIEADWHAYTPALAAEQARVLADYEAADNTVQALTAAYESRLTLVG